MAETMGPSSTEAGRTEDVRYLTRALDARLEFVRLEPAFFEAARFLDEFLAPSAPTFPTDPLNAQTLRSISRRKFARLEPAFFEAARFFEESLAPSSPTFPRDPLNAQMLKRLRAEFSSHLIALIVEEDFEYGFDNTSDVLVRQQMRLNPGVTRSWLNSVFIENFGNVPILLGLLRIIARVSYVDILPEGPTMAVAALSHRSLLVQECGVRAFESWRSPESLSVLESIKVTAPWLQQYVEQVVSDLREEYNVTPREEDRQGQMVRDRA